MKSPRSTSRCPQGTRRMVHPSATESERSAPHKADLSKFFSFARREQNQDQINTRHCRTTETTCRAGRGSCVIEPCNHSYVESPILRPRYTAAPVSREASNARQRRRHPETTRTRQGTVTRAGSDGHRPLPGATTGGAWHSSRGECWAGFRTFSDYWSASLSDATSTGSLPMQANGSRSIAP